MAEVGVLCRKCAAEVPVRDNITESQIHSAVSDPQAWLVDGFGCMHGLAPKTTIGRNHDGQFRVLTASVSRGHAELVQKDTGWQIRDLGSRNGTWVNGQKIQGRVMLDARAVVRFGDVYFWFLAHVAEPPVTERSLATKNVSDGMVRFVIQHPGTELCLVGSGDSQSGGALLARAAGNERWDEHALPPLEFQLLRALCNAAREEAGSPAERRGCVATRVLAENLPFQSRYANEENVRQVVRRVRNALAEIGAKDVVGSTPGRGYYISAPVTNGTR
ncbi:MAG TPA: FHA domain-containing protein [Kofleriaceae bacterium]|nr:FHA domain-containing protein [Kofleriaceae bacterium]